MTLVLVPMGLLVRIHSSASTLFQPLSPFVILLPNAARHLIYPHCLV